MKHKLLLRLVPLLFFLSLIGLNAQPFYVAKTGDNINGDGSSSNPWKTIQFAIDNDAVGNSDVIYVDAGTYTEHVLISKTIDLRGANYLVDPNTETRVVESTIEGVVRVEADGVTVQGFHIDGTNVTQSENLTKRGIFVGNTRACANVSIKYNIVESWVTGISLAGSGTFGWVDGATIDGNLLINNGIGSTENVNDLSITNNAFKNGGIGLGGGVVLADPDPIAGNDFSDGSSYISAASGVTADFSAMLTANTFDKAVYVAQVYQTTGQYPQPWYDRAIFADIQPAIDAAVTGSVIEVAAGIYKEKLDLKGKSLTINGAGSGDDDASNTIIDATGTVGSYGISTFGNSTVISNLQLRNAGHYGIKISNVTGITLTNIKVLDAAKSGIDLNGVVGATLTDIVSENTTLSSHFGLMIGDSKNVTVTNITTANNEWAGVTVQSSKKNYDVDTDNIQFLGDFNANEDIAFLVEKDPHPVSGNYSDITSVDIPSKFNYYVYGLRSGDNYKQWVYFEEKDDAEAYEAAISSTHEDVFMLKLDSPVVPAGAPIEAAIEAASPGDVIHVAPGTYSSIEVNKDDITLVCEPGTEITYSSPAVTVNANNFIISGATFGLNSSNYAIKVLPNYSGTTVTNCKFLTTYGIRNLSTNIVTAENNYWNDASGPTPFPNQPGPGAVVYEDNGLIDYTPWWSDEAMTTYGGLISPINSVTGVSIQPTFEWATSFTSTNNNTNGKEFYLQVSVSENDFSLSKLVANIVVNDEDSYTLGEDLKLNNNKTYYWRIREKNANKNTNVWYFRTYSNVSITQYNPAHGTKVYTPDMTMFTWGVGTYNTSLTFDLQYKITDTKPLVAADWTGTTVTTVPDIEDLTYTAELDGGAKYYWRLIAKYDGEIVKYSSTKYFTTAGGAVKPTASYPLGGVDVYTLTPTLYWYTMTTNDDVTFDIRYGTVKTALTGLVEHIEDTWYEFDEGLLDPGTKYYWQVRSVYKYDEPSNRKESAWSNFGSFKTKGEGTVYKPILSYPVSNAKLYTLTPTFYWYIGAAWDGVVEYDVYVFKSTLGFNGNNLPTIGYKVGTTTDLNYEHTDPLLEAGESYKWMVKAYNDNGNFEWSNTGSFRTEGGGKSRIVLTYPTGNKLISTVTPQFGWYVYGSTLGLDRYKLIYTINTGQATTNAYWDGLINSSIAINDIYETYYTPDTDLEYGEKYIWAVAAFNGSDRQTDWAKTKFRTHGNNSAKIHLSAPANKKTTTTLSPTLMWYVTGNAQPIDHYRVTWSNAALFNTPDPYTQDVITTENFVELSDLEAGSTYYWRVEVSYDGNTYDTYEEWEFYTPAAANGVVMPLVGSPANGVTISDNSPVLSWYLPTQTSAALSYEVELSDNPEFNDASVYNNIPELQAQISGLEEGEYYWRVKSSNGSSESYYSNTGDFKIGDGVTGVEDEEEVPMTYSIDQNYPNPFNPTTTISYSLPEAGFVSVKIYDMLGREVKALVSDNVKAGRHSITWRGDNNYGQNVSSGTYIYRITAGDFVQAKKMILLK